jgi:competence protein ComEC
MTTTGWPELCILDVGHGNCALIEDQGTVFIVDAPSKCRELLRALEQREIDEIDTVIISHGDADHAGLLTSILLDESIQIGRLFVNPEAKRSTKLWTAIRIAIGHARKRYGLHVVIGLTTETTADLQMPRLQVEVLAPTPEVAASGVGGRTIGGQLLTSNAMSAVIRFRNRATTGVLLAGDIDVVGLDVFLDEYPGPRAEVLVYPHHGGRPGTGDPEDFAARLAAAVRPVMVVMSLSRNDSELPRRDVLAGIRSARPQVHIACTQLSRQCSEGPAPAPQDFLSDLPARGRPGACCAGTLEFVFTEDGLNRVQAPAHRDYVRRAVPTPACTAEPADPPSYAPAAEQAPVSGAGN